MKGMSRFLVLIPLLFTTSGRAGFEGSYALTPPPPGAYELEARGFASNFGGWTALATARALIVDTTGAPDTLILDSGPAIRGSGGVISFFAQASGIVQFSYTISGTGGGIFRWGVGPAFELDLIGSTTNLVSAPVEVSFSVEDGQRVELGAYCSGSNGENGPSSQRRVTITDFSAPVAAPEIRFDPEQRRFRLTQVQPIVLSVKATLVNIDASLSFQWERDGLPIPGATNSSVTVTGTVPGSTNFYRAHAKAGAFEAYSAPIETVTVTPSEARLLLHLQFENSANGYFSDSAGGAPVVVGEIPVVPGREGYSAALFSGSGYLRVPAAGTDLELAGSSYTIAWWMDLETDAWQYIFKLGDVDQNLTGYWAMGGRVFQAAHHNGQSLPLNSAPVGSGWQHWAIIYNGLRRELYINGLSNGSEPTAFAVIGSGEDDLIIGPTSAINGVSALGAVDDFRIYNYALTSSEIAALANVSRPAPLLNVSREADFVTIAWSVNHGIEFRVESANSLAPGASWIPLSDPIQNAGNYYQIKQLASKQALYYRLRAL
jgi:hypothetical protein